MTIQTCFPSHYQTSGAYLKGSRSLVISRVSKYGWVGEREEELCHQGSWLENRKWLWYQRKSWEIMGWEVGQTQPSNAEEHGYRTVVATTLEKLLALQTNLRNRFLEEKRNWFELWGEESWWKKLLSVNQGQLKVTGAVTDRRFSFAPNSLSICYLTTRLICSNIRNRWVLI